MIEAHTHWTHKRDGYSVTIVPMDSALYLKDANDANWQPGVAYQLDESDSPIVDSRIFARPEHDFFAKFTQVEEP